jgi:hypothetical protein
MLDERVLQRMQVVASCEALDGRHLRPFDAHREQQARVRPPPVDEDRARAALAVVAALLRAGQRQVLAQCVEQRRARVDVQRVVGTIDVEREVGVMDHTRHSFASAPRAPSRCVFRHKFAVDTARSVRFLPQLRAAV